jgi:hypothetical protein
VKQTGDINVARALMRNATYFSHNRTPILTESRPLSYVGQVGNLRPIVNRPADQYANAAQAG